MNFRRAQANAGNSILDIKIRHFTIFFFFLFINVAFSQQGKSDVAFNTYDDGLQGDGFDGTIRTVVLQTDGKLIVGGDFLNFNGASTPYLCRLLPDGSKDLSFNLGSGIEGKVYCSLIQPDGKIILGGSFVTFNGVNVAKLIRLNADGTRDVTFNSSAGTTNNIIYSCDLQSDGSIVICGSFTGYNGVPAPRVARILPNGNIDTGFAIGSGAGSLVEEIKIQADGKIILGGSFTSFNGTACGRIIRLNSNGTVDATFVQGAGFDDDVSALATQADGKILVGGVFLNFNGVKTSRIIRLNSDGSLDATFSTGSGFSGGVVAVVKLNPAGGVLVGGSFTGTYNGTAVNRLVLLEANGVINPAFDIGAGPFSASVLDLATASDGSWYVSGSFSIFDSQNQGRLARIDAFGALDIGYLTAGVGFDNSVLKVNALSDNKTMVFGNFTKFNGTMCNRIARLSEDGAIDVSFNNSGAGANNSIKTAIVQPDGKVVIAGVFTYYNGVVRNRIARVLANGDIDAVFSIGTGFNNQVYALAVQPDGKIIVGGNFTSYNGVLKNRIARLLPDGTLDSSFNTGSGTDAIVENILLLPDGKIVLGGQFSFFNGISYNRIVRLNADGSIDPGFSIGTGFDKNVYAIALQSDNKLIVGGTFTTYKGVSAKRVLRLNSDGSLDITFATGLGFSNGEIRAVLVQPDDRLLIGGTFSGTYNGTAVRRMVRLLATGDVDTTFSVNLNNTLFSICFTPNNKVLIGGNFNSVSGVTKHRIARIKLCSNSSVWNGSSWNNGMPSAEKTLLFQGNHPSFTTVNSCSCFISAGNTVTIPAGNTLGLVFDYSGSGTLILENNAALYQSEDQVSNSGVIQLKRKTTPILLTDYTYWSSPVLNQKLIDVSPDTHWDKFYSFDASRNSWANEISTNVMSVGKGYIIRGPKTFSETSAANYEAIFAGVPNNGLVSVPIAATGTSNLIGNPYPSAINADLFIIANKETMDGTIYLWTHNTAINKNVYTSDDYAVYNLLGGVGTSAATNSGVNNTKPDGKIASGQSFFMTSINGGGTAIFNNSMRVIGQNASFFKSSAINKSKSEAIEKDRIWLNLSNNEGAFKQILIGYATGATNDFDRSFDGESFEGNQYLDFYSRSQDKNLVIQGRALPFEETDEIKLGFSSKVAGAFIIKIDQTDGVLVNKNVFIEDKLNNNLVDITNESYAFTTAVGIFDDRFVLRYTNKNLISDEFIKEDESVFVSTKNKELQIKSTKEFIEQVVVYNLAGSTIYQKNEIDNNDFSVLNLLVGHQVVLVKIVLQHGRVVTKKIVY
ncbi:T9SS sorting signal type C domain-containing protein [Flavobacterium sp. GSP27]|uniref:T9SS sorting signal type C domain-containing protein n=1 Tax=Flavobacterium sp. GSP27 TaxID=2497489 RepID=UPI000F83E990|nr:T9SS sorting signal type C domain-containing protein [Flavobacterium sp. GSP27]RTY96175.1 T9SS sorting signal type C domain-containing protein [Flavobacterium sp. GSN2]RTZ11324.1 T9SS sorting signal type C domain-containing protein [Flavobacterium sp. GSP27]